MAIYTITSDFGLESYLSAIVKGSIFTYTPNANIIDVSNDVEPQDVYQGAYLFKSALPYFPINSHHFFLVGLYNYKEQNLLITKYKDNFIYFTDNDFASLLFDENHPIFSIKLDSSFEYNVGNIAKAFAMASGFINKGAKLIDFCNPYELINRHQDFNIQERENEIRVQVLYIDKFKNVVLNITQKDFIEKTSDKEFAIEVIGGKRLDKISKGYSDVDYGRALCFFNNAGYLEIAVRKGPAADLFGFSIHEKEDIYKTVKIILYDKVSANDV